MAPTGEAAFHAGGTTVHFGLGVAIKKGLAEGLTQAKRELLSKQNKDLVCLIFDERGLLSNEVVAKAEYNTSQTVYKGSNSNKFWGNVPIVIFIGDDYQLPSVSKGALCACAPNITFNTPEEHIGRSIFLNMGKKVLALNSSKRQSTSETLLHRCLAAQRAEPSKGEVSLINDITTNCTPPYRC